MRREYEHLRWWVGVATWFSVPYRWLVYEVTVEGRFSAAHRHAHPEHGEALHGHDFLVLLSVAGGELVDDVLVDFHELEVELNRHLDELANRELETHPGLAGAPATPATLARFIYQRMSPMVEGVSGIRLAGVEVRDTETTGARYLPKPVHPPAP